MFEASLKDPDFLFSKTPVLLTGKRKHHPRLKNWPALKFIITIISSQICHLFKFLVLTSSQKAGCLAH